MSTTLTSTSADRASGNSPLAEMRGGNVLAVIEIGDRAGHAQHFVVCAGRQAQVGHGGAQQLGIRPPSRIGTAMTRSPIRSIVHTGMNIAYWLVRVTRPIHPGSDTGRCKRDGNPEGILFGETLVFTGTLSMFRAEAADLAAQAGCNVADTVTKATTLLVVGDQDIRMLAGQEKSRKHRKGEELIAKGHAIRILAERDFVRLIHLE
jgi:NAD-dependent DNA ligase